MLDDILERGTAVIQENTGSEGERKTFPTYLGDVEIVGSATYRITGVNDNHIIIDWIDITANHICIKLTGRELSCLTHYQTFM